MGRRVEIPTQPKQPEGVAWMVTLGLIIGRLSGSLYTLEGDSIWLEYEGSGKVFRVIWPHGFSAQLDPIVLFDANGVAVAKEGDILELGGSSIPSSGVERVSTHDLIRVRPKSASNNN